MSLPSFSLNFAARRVRLIAAIVAGLALAWGGSAYWAGLQAEKTLDEQYRLLTGLPFFVVKSHSYDRGWFSSTETTELTFNKKLFAPYMGMLPEQAAGWLDSTVRYTNTVEHGPLPGLRDFDFRPARALVKTEFAMSDATRKTLEKFFGDQPPVTVTNRLNFSGGGTLAIRIPRFDYEETLSGVKVAWQGLDTTVQYDAGYAHYAVDASMPGLLVKAATKGEVQLRGLSYVSDHRPGASGVTLGSSELKVSRIELDSKESLPYEIKLNELVYLLTRLRVGEFINPVGEIRPSRVDLDGLAYQIVTSEQDDFVNTRGKLSFASLDLNQKRYGPMRLDVSANHLHGPTLVSLDKALSAIPVEGVEPVQLREQYLETVKAKGLPLLTNNPKILINDFYLKLPAGDVKVQGDLALTGLTDADLQTPTAFLKKVDARLEVEVPKQTLEDLVVAQARNLFVVDQTAEDPPSLDEIDDLAKNLLASQLDVWQEARYLTLSQGQVKTRMSWQQGKIRVNDQPVSLPWEEETAHEPAGPDGAPAGNVTH
ncbi:Uncharacterized protein conserved in bacteria [Laribacter hongkongensis HLHK9]|uniref:Uncharacterized protein conserved in bacteria n=1 Tax=Laribacter hongkongensis (strain HLHK9) TaxID=557598 RepID=C1D5W9_LARHH|nr:YdgA family protein [Laribacter hongkongensis]ACO74000.1 Uncharacterized protein conserved in bacteria [Laribacter hongkongensis HLHK9]